MAEHEEDKDVSRRYRELPREEPPPALDARIRAEARSALETHAAPLVAPTGRRRWYFPVAAAAVIMLAVAVTTQIEREQPTESVSAALEAKKEGVLEEKPKKREAMPAQAERQQPKVDTAPLAKRAEPPPAAAELPAFQGQKDQAAVESSSGSRSRDEFARDNRARQDRPAASPPAASPPEVRAPAAAAEAETKPERRMQQADAVAGAAARGKLAEETPEAWLERIARLRAEGRHDDADKALAEFRKRYPEYKIPPATLEKVEKR